MQLPQRNRPAHNRADRRRGGDAEEGRAEDHEPAMADREAAEALQHPRQRIRAELDAVAARQRQRRERGRNEREREQVGPLVAAVAPAPLVAVPFLGGDVHDLDGLGQIGEHLLAG